MKKEPQSRFLRACHGLPVDATPVWFMRQAGRYMQEYRQIREKYSFLEVASNPDLAAEVTLQPINAFAFDAAIIFADILLPLTPMGLDLEFVKGVGPVIDNPVRSRQDVDKLRPVVAEEDLGFVMEAIRKVRSELDGKQIPVIGFAGAPFTVASYMIEGGSSRTYRQAKSMMYQSPAVWHQFMDLISDSLISYLKAQVEAGAQALQLFDSWVGALNPADYRNFVLPHSQRVLSALEDTDVPLIHFGTNTTTLLPLIKEAGGTIIGLDWRIPLDEGWRILGRDVGVQGNLDPMALFAPSDVMRDKIHEVLQRAGGRPGHIFNLGHGINRHTDPGMVREAVNMVHDLSAGMIDE